ncbi:MAG: hypothetical protein JXP39_09765, partial [Spirochaetales bacterium]|nr:hypothetical protein [Spirochaetales bacterium]
MRTAPKIAISLILSLLLFTGLTLAAQAGLFSLLETRFYQPAVLEAAGAQLDSVAQELDAWHAENLGKFREFNSADPVKRSLLPNQSEQDIFDRENLAGSLMTTVPGLTGIRIIDAGEALPEGETRTSWKIHYSTFREDILKREKFQISYENYGKKP